MNLVFIIIIITIKLDYRTEVACKNSRPSPFRARVGPLGPGAKKGLLFSQARAEED